jgi:putative redox protein
MTNRERQRTGRAESGAAIARIGAAPFRTNIELPEGHHLVVDAPAFAGGGGAGPAPIDLLMAALAASRATMLRKEADRLGWPMSGASITTRHRRLSRRAIGERGKGTRDIIDCEVHIEGDALSSRQRQKLMELSRRGWPEHALVHECRIKASLVD